MSSDVFSNQLLTLDALRDTFRVISVNLFGTARHTYLEHGDYKKENPVVGAIEVVQFSHRNWMISQDRIQILKSIQIEVDKMGAKLIVISAPLAPAHLNKIKSNKQMNLAFIEYKRTISSIFKNLHDYTTEDMNQYNSTEYFKNSTHPNKKLSQIILNNIWSKK
jgi:hypothetical protein